MLKQQFQNNIIKNQNTASNPMYSIWVNANAGSGKTKVLVDRILRILLNSENHYEILCITYTKTAANEISQRIMTILSRWSYIKENELILELEQLGIINIKPELLLKARILYNTILDSNLPIKIQTIHGFCQNLLETFFIEANITSKFKILEENSVHHLEIKNKVYDKTLIEILNSKNINLNTILSNFTEYSLESFIKDNLLTYSVQLNEIQKKYTNPKDLQRIIFKYFNINISEKTEVNIQEYLLNNCKDTSFDYKTFKYLTLELQNIYSNLNKTEQQNLKTIQEYLELPPKKRADNFNKWYKVFFTDKHTIRKNIFNLNTINKYINTTNFEALISTEINRLTKIQNWIYAYINYEIFKLALFSKQIYSKCKSELNFLDYNDLLLKTLELLKKEQFIPWVFYSLNQRISHILIDEAQDTSPLQWEIIKIISKEVFSNPGENKSIFIVGDIKQSIFSFQGANPEILNTIKQDIKNLVINTNYTWKEIILNVSFRSCKNILDFVSESSKKLFENSNLIKEDNFIHECFNKDLLGFKQINPIIYPNTPSVETEITDQKDITNFKDSHYYLLAEEVTTKIKSLIKEEQFQPKDIMILAANRANNLTVKYLMQLLKAENIPTSGIDKINLLESLAIMDLLSIAKFLLQPLNNLNLATLLKSPIFNFNDNELCKIISESSQKFLWITLKANTQNVKIASCVNKLNTWQTLLSNNLSLFELFNTIINKENLEELYINHFGVEILELFNQFINLIIQFENQNNNTSLEYLIYYLDNINSTINKELDNNINEVKFLTIHGSKGLESKIVFLLDNKSTNKHNNIIIPTNNKELPIIFKLSNKKYNSNYLENILAQNKNFLEEENKRLFYVAITRAIERLYIYTSAKDSKNINKTTRFYKLYQ